MLSLKNRLWTLVICVALLLTLVSCANGGEEASTNNDPLHTEETSSGTSTEELPEEKPGFSIKDRGDSAYVNALNGLTYTASGYDAIAEDSFDFVKGLTISFDEPKFDNKFNRFTLSYGASAPMHIYVTYESAIGAKIERDFYLEAGEGDFSALISEYADNQRVFNLSKIVVDTCKGESAKFALYDVVTEMKDVYSGTCYIQNEKFKLGIDLGWGGTVNYLEDLSKSIDGLTNLVNKHDTGRLIQQSYYGTGAIEGVFEWGSFMESEKWPYNPVQGGDKGYVPSRLIDLEVGENYIYIKSQPMDWGKVNYVTPSYMENKYILEEDCVRVDNRFVDFSGWEHPFKGQELPALYTVSYLDTFIWYGGKAPWTGDEVSSRSDLKFWGDSKYAGDCIFPIYENNTETWCAWVNTDKDFGIGLYVPNVDRLKAGRYQYDGTKDANANPTNYVAPYNTIKLVSFEALEYSYLLTTGSAEEIRTTFAENKDFATNETLHKNYSSSRLPSIELDMSDIDFSVEANGKVFTSANNASANYDADEKAVKLTVDGEDPYLYLNYAISDKDCLAEDYERVDIVYMIPTTNSEAANHSRLFTCTGAQSSATGTMSIGGKLIADGQYHTLSYNVGAYNFWTGKINQLRFDFFENAEKGDVMYVRSIKLIKKAGSGNETVAPVEGTLIDFSKEENSAIVANPRNTDTAFDAAKQAMKLVVTDPNDVHVSVAFNVLAEAVDAEKYPVLKIVYMIPTTNGNGEYDCDLFLCAGEVVAPTGSQRIRAKLIADGEFHTLELDLSKQSYWKGTVNMIRIDYFDNCVSGDVFYLKSIELAE